ncbi:MAG: hypothetical protein H6851_05145 [Geminicoccaceae bacterium]|nr:hypothetical protein [Geminicoccaceae bacterium]
MGMIAATALMAAGAGIQAWGALQEGNAAKDAADWQATVQRQNAALRRRQASADEEKHRSEMRQRIGMQRAAEAESGFALAGSALDLLEQTVRHGELDALNIRYAGQLDSRALELGADNAELDGINARRAGRTRAVAALIGGIGQAGGRLASGIGGTTGGTTPATKTWTSGSGAAAP